MQALTIILLCLTSIFAFCAETPVQMTTLRWSGDGEFMSWRWEMLGEEKRATRPRPEEWP